MTDRTELQSCYAYLASQPRESLTVTQLGVSTPDGPLLVALDDTGLRHLLIPVADLDKVREDRSSRGVAIDARPMIDSGKDMSFADVHTTDAENNELFLYVAEEIANLIDENPADGIAIAQASLERWRSLFLPNRRPQLGSLVGLFGELHMLQRIVQLDPGLRHDVWCGPSNSSHDFLRGALAVEVKTSEAREGRLTEIHGLRQLVPPTGGRLCLAYIRVQRAASGQSVPTLVDELLRLGVSSHGLLKLLAQVGYAHSDRREYEDHLFEIVEEMVFEVDDAFPRIVPASFPNGVAPESVQDVRYRVDLAGPEPKPLDTSAEAALLKEMATS